MSASHQPVPDRECGRRCPRLQVEFGEDVMNMVLDRALAHRGPPLRAGPHRRVDPANASHIAIPFAGKLVDVLVDEGDDVKEGDVLCVVQQMKMELEVRSPRSGTCSWVVEAEEGEDVGEGWLLCIIEREGGRL